ncbi:T-cell-specific surface glycoprotein CD28 isoform X2 [Hyla sarda]|uniref:T-cell-specific surface glycoprotein CD28 isoform X2 n=1 Tax=Hyla sarda TaxID=327740 RepID=UPI0024C40482|nr:T-cell-specific surface glycoprotein CD28 isoform X2 [Hyla sarda]
MNATMVLGMIWSVGLIMLAQSIGFFVEGKSGARSVDDSCRLVEKLLSPCDGQLHHSFNSSLLKNHCTFYTQDNNSLTFYHNFNASNKEFRVSLIRGINKKSIVCEGSFNASQSQLPFDYNNCKVIPSASQVTFHLWSINEEDTDIYFFCKEDMYPPPYICDCDEGTIIHVKEHKQHEKVKQPEKDIKYIQEVPLSVLIVLGCIAAYSLIITTSFLYILRKKRRTRILQSEYINVVPRRPKNHMPSMPYATRPVHPCSR